MTAVITGERGTDSLTRCGLEEYVADCVIVLDHRVGLQESTRRVRVVKYSGSAHETSTRRWLRSTRSSRRRHWSRSGRCPSAASSATCPSSIGSWPASTFAFPESTDG